MPAPKKQNPKNIPEKKPPEKKSLEKNKLQISVAVPSLSGIDPEITETVISEVKNNIYKSINDAELQKALDKWAKDNHTENKIVERDYHVLKSVVTEYLDSYMLFGYNTKGERIIIQHAESPRDRDAVMEFLKTIFIQQQQTSFLDIENDDLD